MARDQGILNILNCLTRRPEASPLMGADERSQSGVGVPCQFSTRAMTLPRTPRRAPRTRNGVTLVESVATVVLSALLMLPLVALIKTSVVSWEGADGEASRRLSVEGALRHVADELSNCQSVVLLSALDDAQGQLDAQRWSGGKITWSLSNKGELSVQESGQKETLAKNIERFWVAGIEADGVTTTDDPTRTHAVRCTIETTIPGTQRNYTLSRVAMLRNTSTTGGKGKGNGKGKGKGDGKGVENGAAVGLNNGTASPNARGGSSP